MDEVPNDLRADEPKTSADSEEEPGGLVNRPSLATMLGRGLRRRCPVCGVGRLFCGWFRMPERCEYCHYHFERGPGYWLGSIYVNYGLTALLVTGAYFVLFFTDALPQTAVLWLLAAFCVAFPLWFFRFARSIWMAFDLHFDPVQDDEVQLNDGDFESESPERPI